MIIDVPRFTFFIALLLSACTPGTYKTPTLSGDAGKMSQQTLCYRYAYAKADPAIKAEVKARRLDCEEELRGSQPVGASRY